MPIKQAASSSSFIHKDSVKLSLSWRVRRKEESVVYPKFCIDNIPPVSLQTLFGSALLYDFKEQQKISKCIQDSHGPLISSILTNNSKK